MTSPLISIRKLKKFFPIGNRVLKAVDDFSLDIFPGETLGLVGESGCGKTTVGRCLLHICEPTGGSIFMQGEDLVTLKGASLKKMRRKIQMIFQDPYSSLNPRMTIQDIVGEALDIHKLCKGTARKKRVEELLELVGLKSEHMSRFPHEFSGGQRQRIGIARALAVAPDFIICDEPISALDVSIQAQVVNLLKQLQRQMGLTYLFISHDLSMVKFIADRVAVMYLGNIVELADSTSLYLTPLHPYTEALLSAIPLPDPRKERNHSRIILKGEIPSAISPPSGCPFRNRCPKAFERCSIEKPLLKEVKRNHYVACHLYPNEEKHEISALCR